MKKKIKNILIISTLFFTKTNILLAQGSTLNPLKVKSIKDLIEGVLSGATYILTPIIVLAIIYAGFLFLKAQGEPGELEKAKNAFTNAIIGAIIILAANLIFTVVYSTVDDLRG